MLSVGMGLAQGRPEAQGPNPALAFDLGLGVVADSDETELRADLGVSYVTQTRDQTLSFTADTDVPLVGDDSDGSGFLPRLGATYAFDNGASLLELAASYSLREVDGLAFVLDEDFSDIDDPEDLVGVEDDGRLATTRLSAGLALWRRDPVGLELGAAVLDRSYRDTVDPDLTDTRRVDLDAALRLSPRPGLDYRLTASRSRSEDDDLLDAETVSDTFGARVTWQATPTLALDLSVGRTEVREERNVVALTGAGLVATDARETIRNEGITFAASATQLRPNGTRVLRLERDVNEQDAVLRFELGRTLGLPGGATLGAALGVAQFEGGEAVAIGQLDYALDLPRGVTFSAALAREASRDGDDQETARNSVGLSVAVPLTPVSGVAVGVRIVDTEVIEGFEADDTVSSVTVGYDYALTPDWALAASYTHRAARTDGEDTERDDRFSLRVARSFTFRP
jgi:hypothetical protein